MNYYILANGEGKRWGNYKGVPKHLIEIDGETLIDRTVRLLAKHRKKGEKIIICGPYEHPKATTWLTKSPTKREAFQEIAEHAGKTPFAILYGDSYHTEAFIKDIIERPIKGFDEYISFGGNAYTGCQWNEGHVHRVADVEWFRDQMAELNASGRLRDLDRGKDWFIHWWLLGARTMPELQQKIFYSSVEHDIIWYDETDDFDYPEDLDTFCERTGHKCTNKEEA